MPEAAEPRRSGMRDPLARPARPSAAGRRRPRRAAVSASRSIRSSARWTAERWIPSRSASSPSVASGVSRRASATEPDDVGLLRELAARASSSSIAAIWRPAAPTARWRFADSALMTRFRSPRSARDTWRASTSSSAPVAPIRRRNVPDEVAVLPASRRPRPRRIRHEAGSPASPSRSASTARRPAGDDELEVGPAAGQAERAVGEEQAAQPGQPAMFGRGVPVERGRRPGAAPERSRGPARSRPPLARGPGG